jgi:hypothetical protein
MAIDLVYVIIEKCLRQKKILNTKIKTSKEAEGARP